MNGMWFGGVVRDIFGGVLWLGFFWLLWVSDICGRLLLIQSDRGNDDTISCYLGSMLGYRSYYS